MAHPHSKLHYLQQPRHGSSLNVHQQRNGLKKSQRKKNAMYHSHMESEKMIQMNAPQIETAQTHRPRKQTYGNQRESWGGIN